jgi:hypothetical protein
MLPNKATKDQDVLPRRLGGHARHQLGVAAGFLFVALLSGYGHYQAAGQVDVFIDERLWTGRAYFYRLAFLDRDVGHRLWVYHDGIDQPHVTDFLIGASLHAFDTVPPVPEGTFSGGGESPLGGRRLLVVRAPCALLGAGVAVLVYALGLLASGRLVVGTVAGTLYACHPLVLKCQVRAMSDGPLLFFTCLGMVLVTWALGSGRRGDGAARAFSVARCAFLALGPLALALALGTKLTGLVPILAFVSSLGVVVAWEFLVSRAGSPTRGTAWLAWGALALALTGGWAVAVNPTLYSAPVSRFREMLEHRRATALGQSLKWRNSKLDDYPQQVRALYDQLVWKTGQFRQLWLNRAQLGLVLLGFCYLCLREGQGLLGIRGPSPALPLLAWALVLLGVLTPSMPLNWDRYYLPYLPCWTLFTGFGVAFVIDQVRRCIARARGVPTSSHLVVSDNRTPGGSG